MAKKSSNSSSDSNEMDKSFKTIVKNATWAYKTMFRFSKRDTLFYILSSILVSVVPIISAYLVARLLDEIITLAASDISSVFTLEITSPFFLTLMGVAFTSFLNQVMIQLKQYMSERFDHYHLELFEVEMLSKISTLDIIQFEDPETSNNIRKARDNTYKLFYFVSNSSQVLVDTVTLVVSGVIAFTASPLITITVVVLSIPNSLVFARFIRVIWNYYNSRVEKNRIFWWIIWALSEERAMPEHKVTASNKYISQFSYNLRKELQDEDIHYRTDRFTGSIFTALISSTLYILTPLTLISKILAGSMTIGQFTFVQGRFFEFSSTLNNMLGRVLEMFDAGSYLTYLRRIYEMEPAIICGSEQISTNQAPTIEFRNVSFKYPKAKKYALKNVNFSIQPGEDIAIVGENGAGKTTLIKLILRFYEPTEGEILINGKPIESFNIDQYHELFGALFQEFNIYEPFSVKENIMIGDYQAKEDTKRIKDAAIQADAHEFIEKLEYKYDTKLAKQFSGGTNLSTGQTQKVALARMFYRNRPILILDEPTASIDAEAEYRIFKRIYEFTNNKTVIIISHRFSTVRNAKKIFVLHQGEIVEKGSHEELMKKNGKYAKAFNLQAKGYQGN